MSSRLLKIQLMALALGFTTVFCVVVLPPLWASGDIVGAFLAGFVNPYASGYSADVLFCWGVLALWVTYEAKVLAVKGGWMCLLLGVVPGVAVGFAVYLIVRMPQIKHTCLG